MTTNCSHACAPATLPTCAPASQVCAERDLMQILAARPRHAVYILQQCFGCGPEDAQAAWNDFVLRYLDGPIPVFTPARTHPRHGHAPVEPPGALARGLLRSDPAQGVSYN